MSLDDSQTHPLSRSCGMPFEPRCADSSLSGQSVRPYVSPAGYYDRTEHRLLCPGEFADTAHVQIVSCPRLTHRTVAGPLHESEAEQRPLLLGYRQLLAYWSAVVLRDASCLAQ